MSGSASASTLYLVDGYALIYRAFFAMIARPLTTRRGENTSAAWGVTNFLLRLLERRRPDYLAWVHDVGESFRHQAFPSTRRHARSSPRSSSRSSTARSSGSGRSWTRSTFTWWEWKGMKRTT